MPRTSTPDTLVETPVEGLTEVVEALTAEAAIEQVHSRLGPDARILDARRVLRGGIGGFFSREHVQLHAAPALGSPSPGVPTTPPPTGAPVSPPPTGGPASAPEAATTSPVDRLLRGAADVPEAMDFATYLRTQLAPDVARDPADAASPRPIPTASAPPGTPAASEGPTATHEASGAVLWPAGSAKAQGDITRILPPEPTRWASPEAVGPMEAGSAAWAATEDERPAWAMPAAPIPTPDSTTITPGAAPGEPRPASDGGPAWSIPVLLRLGLPVELVRGLEVAAPNDDLAWTNAVAEAVRPLCRPLPTGPSVLVGPEAHLLTEVAAAPAARSRTWLNALGDGRWRHLVLGGDRWRQELADEPLAVSWAQADDLPDALRCAAELGMVLGFGPLRNGIGRARPLDVALAVRDLVDVR